MNVDVNLREILVKKKKTKKKHHDNYGDLMLSLWRHIVHRGVFPEHRLTINRDTDPSKEMVNDEKKTTIN